MKITGLKPALKITSTVSALNGIFRPLSGAESLFLKKNELPFGRFGDLRRPTELNRCIDTTKKQ